MRRRRRRRSKEATETTETSDRRSRVDPIAEFMSDHRRVHRLVHWCTKHKHHHQCILYKRIIN